MVVPATRVLLGDVQNKAAVYDVTSQYSVDAVQAIASTAFTSSSLVPGVAKTYAVVKGLFTPDQMGNLGNSMLPLASPLEPGKAIHYRFVSLSSGNFMVGVSTQSHFKPNWGMRSIGLNGSNGGLIGRGLMKSDYSPSFNTTGTTIDWIMEAAGDDLSVYILLNNEPLGPAWKLNFAGHSELLKDLCPCVSFADAAPEVVVAMIEYENSPVTAVYKGRQVTPDVEKPYLGTWCPVVNEWAPLVFPEDRTKLHVSDDRIAFTVMNTQSVGVKIGKGPLAPTSPIASTLMAALPPFDKAETAAGAFLGSLQSWSVEAGVLSIVSGSHGVKHFKPFGPTAVTDNPLVD